MTEAPDNLPARPAGRDAALPDGGRRTVVVTPEEVWAKPAAASPPPDPHVELKETRRAFYGPITLVVGLSSALLAAFLLAVALMVTVHG